MSPELPRLILQHLVLVLVSTGLAVLVGIPTGIALAHRERLMKPVLAVANILQTIPSLALFGFLLPLPFIGGIGARTAIVALVLYALLPLIRNTIAGMQGVDPTVREAATAMGMTPRQILFRVELPLALGVILTGVRVATVVGVGVATIAAAIGAGGLGTYIFRGLRMDDNRLILEGAVPAALLALGLDACLGLLAARMDRRARPTGPSFGARRPALSRFALGAVVALGSVASAAWLLGAPVRALFSPAPRAAVVVGAKDFTEQLILGELLAQELEARGVVVERTFELGGNLCRDALASGRIDVYPEYTGTALTALYHQPLDTDPAAVLSTVRRLAAERDHATVSGGLGFRNDFAILVRGADARRFHLRTISDAAAVTPGFQAAFGQDFMSRPDGYPGFVRAYGLRWRAPPREMDLSLTYRALAAHEVDLIAGNSTDGLIAALDLAVLDDDRRDSPPYEAVFIARTDTLARVPALSAAMGALTGALDTDAMRRLNYEVDGKKRRPADVARSFRAGPGTSIPGIQ